MGVGSELRKLLKTHDGVDINQQVVDDWVEEIGDKLARCQKSWDMTFISSGNMIVIGTNTRHSDGTCTVDVKVCRIERNGYICVNTPAVPQQTGIYCSCTSPKLKRVDISSSLGYDYCEACKKEKK